MKGLKSEVNKIQIFILATFETRFFAHATWVLSIYLWQKLDFCQATGTGIWDLEPGTWDLGPGTWDLNPSSTKNY